MGEMESAATTLKKYPHKNKSHLRFTSDPIIFVNKVGLQNDFSGKTQKTETKNSAAHVLKYIAITTSCNTQNKPKNLQAE